MAKRKRTVPAEPLAIPDRPTRNEIAVKAHCDERTVYRHLTGRGKTQRAIEVAIRRAMADLGV